MALAKAVIISLDSPQTPPIPVMFNPPQYSITKTNQFAEIKIPGLPSSVLQFVNGDAGSLIMELFFDTTDSGDDVRKRTCAVSNLTAIDQTTKAPPRLLLLWGSLAFEGFLVSVRQMFDYFNSMGIPLRATLTVEFKGQDNVESGLAAVPLAQIAQAVRYVVRAGDTLQQLAAVTLKDPRNWRQIAMANNIDDPRTLVPGTQLVTPRLV